MLIGELSQQTGVSARLLRYYEEQGLLEAARAANGYRHYGDDSVLTVRKIRVLLNAGLSTEVIRTVLPCTRDDQPEFDLDHELAALDGRIEDLQRSRGTLSGFLTQPSDLR